ncbi:hypothetical protein ACWGID_12155 [Kribbella sp. NPDC054772]
MRRTLAAAAGVLLALPVLTTISPASATPTTQTANACYVQAGALTTGKDSVDRYVNATAPISVKPVSTMAKAPYGDRAVSLSSEWT